MPRVRRRRTPRDRQLEISSDERQDMARAQIVSRERWRRWFEADPPRMEDAEFADESAWADHYHAERIAAWRDAHGMEVPTP